MTPSSTAPLAAAFAVAREALARVDERRLGEPTPCLSWDVHALVNHMIGGPRLAASLVAGTVSTDETGYAIGDVVGQHDETTRVALGAFRAPGALNKAIEFPFGERPASLLMFFVATA